MGKTEDNNTRIKRVGMGDREIEREREREKELRCKLLFTSVVSNSSADTGHTSRSASKW